jgi:hypothetical protein
VVRRVRTSTVPNGYLRWLRKDAHLMLLILSGQADGHVPKLTPKLEERGAEYLWFDPACFPGEARLSLGFNRCGVPRGALCYRGREYDLSAITAVWYRRPGKPEAGTAVREETHRGFVERASQRYLEGVWETLDCRWLPAKPAAERAAENKLLQLAQAARLGFTVPETLVTNNPRAFLDFYAECDSNLVSKSLVFGEVERDGESHLVVYTHPVRRRDVGRYQSIRHSPVIFQTYVPKRVELRVTVVGRRVFAAEIASQESRSTRHDWRRYDDPRIRYRAHALPDEIESRCVRLVEALGLCFGAIDLILTPDGEYVFLEINPNGQWWFVERLSGLPIADAIADLLTGRTATEAA